MKNHFSIVNLLIVVSVVITVIFSLIHASVIEHVNVPWKELGISQPFISVLFVNVT